jgi:GT2 family glycosyltransferase
MQTDAPTPPDGASSAVQSVYSDPGYGADAALDAFAQPDAMPVPVDPRELQHHHVTTVVVAHDGERWLPGALEALVASDRPSDRIVAVDTGSRDTTPQLLADALGGHAIRTAGKRTGFGEAVAAGIEHAERQSPIPQGWPQRTEWVWILHDDCAPAPDALRRLLECAVRRPEAAVIGPKVRSWGDDRQLLEVGISITRGGRRHTGLEKREYDQGQHDVTREVLAVGSAGMLVRRDVWDELAGFDRNLPVFRDDVDFGWRANLAGYTVLVCPPAIVQHAEAAAHGRRRIGATRQRVHMIDRRNALYVLLANTPGRRWLLVLLRLIVAAFGRAVAFMIGKQPALAVEEIGAVLAVVGRPDRIIRARVDRSRYRKKAPEDISKLFPPAGQQLRHAGESVLAVITGAESGHDLPSSRRRAVTTGEPADDDEPIGGDAAILSFLTRPPVLLIGGLVLLTLAASRRMLLGGRLLGGGLFPAPDSPASLWAAYTDAWHGIGIGSDTAAAPYVAVVAALSSVFRSPSFVIDMLLLGSVPLAGATAFLVFRRLVDSRALRIWAAGLYALLPATSGAIAGGRLGTAVAAVVTPLVVLAVMRTLGVSPTARQRSRESDQLGPFRAAWSAGLALAVVTAFVPLAWLAALLLAVVGAATIYRSVPAAARLAVILAVSPIVLAPWTLDILRAPRMLLTEAGVPGPDLSDPNLAPWSVLLQHAGGPGAAPMVLGAILVAAAFAGLIQGKRLPAIMAAWTVVLVGLALGLLVSREAVTGPTLETPVAGWPGYPVVLVGGGLIVAATLAAAGIRTRLRDAAFGWQQPLAMALVVLAGITPLAAAGWWLVRGADDPLERRDPALLPAYVAEEAEREDGVRTLVLNRPDDGRVTYSLLRSSGPRLGDAEVGPAPEANAVVDDLVGDLVSDRGGADVGGLIDLAVRYVYLPPPADAGLAEIFDTIPGLARASAPDGGAMWEVAGEIARARVLGGDQIVRVPSGGLGVAGTIPPGPEGRTLVLAEQADDGWSATLAGAPLSPTTHDGWAQAFELPENGGDVAVSYDDTNRSRWLLAQLAAVLVAIVLALPGMRRAKGAVDAAADVDTGEVPTQEPTAEPAVPVPAVPVGAPQQYAQPEQYTQPVPEPYGQPGPQPYVYPEPSVEPEPAPYGQPGPQPYGYPEPSVEPEPYGRHEPQPYGYPEPYSQPYEQREQQLADEAPPEHAPLPEHAPSASRPGRHSGGRHGGKRAKRRRRGGSR